MARTFFRSRQSLIWLSTLGFLASVGESKHTPSNTCQMIVESFGVAVSDFTLCSITYARPIHLCGLCVEQFMAVVHTHQNFTDTKDDRGNLCQEYFTNLDRMEIVSEAYNYVQHLWKKGNCDYCYKKSAEGKLTPEQTEDMENFGVLYEETQFCFKSETENETCTACKKNYDRLNRDYIQLSTEYGEHICLDIVDTMNITREIWSQYYNCTKEKRYELALHIGFGVVACIPVIFYIMAVRLSNKQEASVIQQKRMAEIFAINSQSTSTARGTGIEETDNIPETGYRNTFARERSLR